MQVIVVFTASEAAQLLADAALDKGLTGNVQEVQITNDEGNDVLVALTVVPVTR